MTAGQDRQGQLMTSRVANLPEGAVLRVPFGSERTNPVGEACNGCGVRRGVPHEHGCAHEECPRCQGWFRSCGCFDSTDEAA
jgi:hypothetical protein